MKPRARALRITDELVLLGRLGAAWGLACCGCGGRAKPECPRPLSTPSPDVAGALLARVVRGAQKALKKQHDAQLPRPANASVTVPACFVQLNLASTARLHCCIGRGCRVIMKLSSTVFAVHVSCRSATSSGVLVEAMQPSYGTSKYYDPAGEDVALNSPRPPSPLSSVLIYKAPFGLTRIAIMDYLGCCFGRRKPANRSDDTVNTNTNTNTSTSHSRLSEALTLSQQVSGGEFGTLTDLRQKCEANTLSTAEARALLNASGKYNEPLTPREIEELHRILSPPSAATKPGSSSSATAIDRSLRTPTNHMLPEAQLQSDLFCLPAEVRTQIWRYAIGGRKIHLAVKDGKLVQQSNIQRPYWRGIKGLLSIPLLCRTSYLESINLLYSENTFCFGFGSSGSSHDFFTQADTLLLPQCVAAMTSLEVGFHLSGGYSQYYDSHSQAWDITLEITAPEPLCNWNSVFKALSQMKQLRSLVVVVWASGDRRHEFMAREPELMDIPTRMTGLKKFDVWLPWEEDDDGVPAQHADNEPKPYIVRRKFEDRERFGVSVPNWRGRISSSYVCTSCLASSHSSSVVSRGRCVVARHHVRPLSTTIASENTKPWPPLKKKKRTKPKGESQKAAPPPAAPAKELSETDAERQLKVLQGALSALQNVLTTQGVDVSSIPTTKHKGPPQVSTAEAKTTPNPKAKPNAGKKGNRPPKATAPNALDKSVKNASVKLQSKPSVPTTEATPFYGSPNTPPIPEAAGQKEAAPIRRLLGGGSFSYSPEVQAAVAAARLAQSDLAKRSKLSEAQEMESEEAKPADLGVPFEAIAKPFPGNGRSSTKSASTRNKPPLKINPDRLSLVPIQTIQPPVPPLSYGLDRVLFNPGVYHIQDPRSRVYNFDPYLTEIMPVNEFDFNALKEYVTSSKDTTLISIAKQHQKRYTGSTSSMTSMLAHFHFLISAWRSINTSMLSRSFVPESTRYTVIMRAPAAIFLHWKDGTYAIDADKEFDTANVLSMLGKSMEKLLTLSKDEYERYRHGNSDQITEEERNAEEAYHYTGFQDFMMRSQLDAHDPRIKGTGMFDLKTRAVISIRMDAAGYHKGLGYEIRQRFGQWESFEREYYDMIRSAFLKYSLQVRMGRMDGIFVAFHNTQRIFGFQYIPITEMDLALHGTENRRLGDQEFKVSLKLLNELIDRATQKWPERSLRLHVETRTSTDIPFMYFFAKPTTPDEIAAVQNAGKASVEAFEKNILGLVKNAAETDAEDLTDADGVNMEDPDEIAPLPSPESQEIDSLTAWQEARQMVEDAMGDDEIGVGVVREAIGDALEQSGILRARSLAESHEYVNALLGALTGRTEDSAPIESGDVSQPEVPVIQPQCGLHPNQAAEAAHEMQTHNSQTTPAEDVREGYTTTANEDIDETTTAGPSASEHTASERESEDDDYEETSGAELKSDIEVKGSSEDIVSPSLEPLKSLIMRTARKMDETQVFDTDINVPQDDAAKLREFERILYRLISQSKTEQPNEESSDDVSDQSSSSQTSLDGASADNTKTAESESTQGVQREGKPQPDVMEQTKPGSKTEESELLGLTLTIKNKVNGTYVQRPDELGKDDNWIVEYEIEEIPKHRAHTIYTANSKKRAPRGTSFDRVLGNKVGLECSRSTVRIQPRQDGQHLADPLARDVGIAAGARELHHQIEPQLQRRWLPAVLVALVAGAEEHEAPYESVSEVPRAVPQER
ncbi:hypothetical protein NUW58_g7306 [Xylaria curta]|uniref:Uncharacterized protein n=1 Tax=Xylaria curta TaxID=42375 RepID=A0ACC1NKB3_9PEZI|nr:hypothetical protein NUW58_g7306 [Xylaria curta]